MSTKLQIAAIWAVVSLTACASSSAPSGAGATAGVQRHPSPTARLVTGAPAHIAVIVMENEEYGGIIGSPSAPCLNSLARRYALAIDQLERAHLSWRAYMQDLPGGRAGICFTGASAGEYAKKHDPFAYYTRITGNWRRCANIVPLAQLAVWRPAVTS